MCVRISRGILGGNHIKELVYMVSSGVNNIFITKYYQQRIEVRIVGEGSRGIGEIFRLKRGREGGVWGCLGGAWSEQ